MFIFVYSDFESFFRTYFALVILLSSDFCFSLLYLYPTVLSEHKKEAVAQGKNPSAAASLRLNASRSEKTLAIDPLISKKQITQTDPSE
ncbi:MAG: hypothetical protein ACLSUC_13485 [Subdoligranulum sp.]